MAFPFTELESNRESLGCDETGDAQHEYAADKSAENCIMQSCQHGP